jgi:hypothetical protein
MRFERPQKTRRDGGNVIDRGQERAFVRSGWLIKTADFSYELKRSGPNFLGGYRRIEVEKCFDVSAHGAEPSNHRAPTTLGHQAGRVQEPARFGDCRQQRQARPEVNPLLVAEAR